MLKNTPMAKKELTLSNRHLQSCSVILTPEMTDFVELGDVMTRRQLASHAALISLLGWMMC